MPPHPLQNLLHGVFFWGPRMPPQASTHLSPGSAKRHIVRLASHLANTIQLTLATASRLNLHLDTLTVGLPKPVMQRTASPPYRRVACRCIPCSTGQRKPREVHGCEKHSQSWKHVGEQQRDERALDRG